MKQILLSPDPADGGKSEIDAMKKTIAELKAENAKLTGVAKQSVEDEKLIAEKVAMGLTRDQAIAVIKRQRDHGAKRIAEYNRNRLSKLLSLKDPTPEHLEEIKELKKSTAATPK